MSLKELPVLLVDAQTTGMRPPAAHLLELAWSVENRASRAFAASTTQPAITSRLVRLPDGVTIPRRVSEITGLTNLDLTESACTRDELKLQIQTAISDAQAFVIHYAQFEKPFLLDLLAIAKLPLPVLCTHQLVQRLFPNLPRQNIRATAGFFGPAVIGHNRAGTFVRATQQIWRGLTQEFERLGLTSLDELMRWLQDTPRPKATRYEYRLDKEKRLDLPDSPGIYRMLGKNGEVLYVGKATSLKSRVNSYFRGKKGRDQRKLEMLAQVWDLHVTPTPTPLEAALLESDEIKRLDPPYNVVLKTGQRQLVFYARDFSTHASAQSAHHPIGPYRHSQWIESLQKLAQALTSGEFDETLFFEPLPSADLRAGYALFSTQHGVSHLRQVREFLSHGLKLHRAFAEPLEDDVADEAMDTEPTPKDDVVTIEDIRDKFERLWRRAGAQYWRMRRLTRLLDARVELGDGRHLQFQRGHLLRGGDPAPLPADPAAPWANLAIDTYDRMSILRAELDRRASRRA